MKRIIYVMMTVCSLALATPAVAQQTTGNITGRILDDQNAAVPGVTVTGKNTETGLVRTVVTDGEGIYRLTALPVGTYDILAELQGFSKVENKGIVVNVGQTVDLDVALKVAGLTEAVEVRAETSLIQHNSSSVGGVVDVDRIESMPLNGRQFANAAITIPGVGLGFHSDPTKSTQYSPQIAGGNGRNVNYQIDGGDNNDDTVGGLLQLFPLEAIQEFNFVTQRYKAEYGRSNGGVMNIVTKGGTNQLHGSWFTNVRDKSLNAETKTEKISRIGKQPYKRYQYGGSFGGPIVQNKAHFFAAYERTQQDTQQAVNTRGLFTSEDGSFPTPSRENLLTGKVSSNLTPSHYLSVRYGRNTNSQVYSATSIRTPENWGDSTNSFNSFNVNHNWVLAGSKLNEFIFQYADFENHIVSRTDDPQQSFPNGVFIGYNTNTPQSTIQHKFQFRDDFSWHVTGAGGLGHDFKAGMNYIHEPKLYVTFSSGSSDYAYTHLTNDLNGPISTVTRNKPGASANLPMDQYGFYVQDDWRATDRLTINAGLRYDLSTGFLIDQSKIPNFVALTGAAAAGRFDGVPGFEEFGQKAQEDKNNWQPRVGVVYNLRRNGEDVVRAGWGIYYDYGFTNANILFPGLSAQGGSGVIFTATNTSGLRNPDGTFFTASQPISNIERLNEVNPNGPFYGTNVAAPQIRQPFTSQTSVGWSHEFTPSTVFDVDYVHVAGRDLGVRWPLNTRINGGNRRYQDLNLNPANPTLNMSIGESNYDGVNFGVRRRMTNGIQFSGWYTLSKAEGFGGFGVDELTTNLVQDATNPFADVGYGPSQRTDARHKVTLSAIVQAPWGITVSPVFQYRSALPIHVWYGYDVNNDGVTNDIYTTAYKFKSVDDAGVPSWEEIGTCETINCGRGAALSQFNVRVGKIIPFGGGARLEVFGEFFNVFNALNPSFAEGSTGTLTAGRLFTGTAANPASNAAFMKPTAYAGDNGVQEQRLAQLGFRFTF
jgi:Carboxypeptidase regulatory-like domain/TonB dependent receptor-like, beta-barrel